NAGRRKPTQNEPRTQNHSGQFLLMTWIDHPKQELRVALTQQDLLKPDIAVLTYNHALGEHGQTLELGQQPHQTGRLLTKAAPSKP
ncbi:MAG: hypothetical protein ACKPKO_09885, partial [Candidatus Fonsibacter sp.]